MKKTILLIFVPFFSLFSLSAQITQAEADSIVKKRMSNETSDFTIFAKEDVQTGFEITTSTSETLELNYPCWIYYVNFIDETNGKYLIVKESNGNLLEINTKNDEAPDGLEEWRKILPIEIPFEEYSLVGTFCQWINLNYPNFPLNGELIIINSDQELDNYITCLAGSYPEIDFLKYTLLLANGTTHKGISEISKHLLQLSIDKYKLNIKILLNDADVDESWDTALIVNKLKEESNVELNVTFIYD